MSEFSDRPLVAGTIVGLRAFAVDNLGRLYGPSYGQIFTPGENEAECRKNRDDFSSSIFGRAFSQADYYRIMGVSSPVSLTSSTATTGTTPSVKHTPGVMDCKCGFYAYFNGRNDYKDASRITAIIEGYGVVTYGTDGFRAQKARLIAIVEPAKRFPRLRDALHRNYPEVPFYERKRDALDAHPLSIGRVPSPEDEDFWTRDAR